MTWSLLLVAGLLLIALVSGLAALFFHWVSLGFEVKKMQVRVENAQISAGQMKEDIEDIKKELKDER